MMNFSSNKIKEFITNYFNIDQTISLIVLKESNECTVYLLESMTHQYYVKIFNDQNDKVAFNIVEEEIDIISFLHQHDILVPHIITSISGKLVNHFPSNGLIIMLKENEVSLDDDMQLLGNNLAKMHKCLKLYPNSLHYMDNNLDKVHCPEFLISGIYHHIKTSVEGQPNKEWKEIDEGLIKLVTIFRLPVELSKQLIHGDLNKDNLIRLELGYYFFDFSDFKKFSIAYDLALIILSVGLDNYDAILEGYMQISALSRNEREAITVFILRRWIKSNQRIVQRLNDKSSFEEIWKEALGVIKFVNNHI